MKIVILAGGLGTRISEETQDKPKPMVLIDDKPILWHLMNIFSTQGFDEFVLALGYKSEVIKRWLIDLNELDGDLKIDTENNSVERVSISSNTSWKVIALETGFNTQTGGRIAQCMNAFPGERVIATYGDGLANIPIRELIDFHESHGKLATVTAVRPPARFGYLEIDKKRVTHFGEKNQSDAGWINGGFFVLEPEVSDFISGDDMPFERDPLVNLTAAGQLRAYKHEGFWQPMDTLRERNELEALWQSDQAPWKIW